MRTVSGPAQEEEAENRHSEEKRRDHEDQDSEVEGFNGVHPLGHRAGQTHRAALPVGLRHEAGKQRGQQRQCEPGSAL